MTLHSTKVVWASIGISALIACPPRAKGGMSCPSATNVDICIQNPTASGVTVTVSGCVISGEATCGQMQGVPATSYSNQLSLAAGGLGSPEQCFTEQPALISGDFVHNISAPSGQLQHQKMPVLNGFHSQTPNTRVHWKYFPNVVNVNLAGDAGGTCPPNCTFRQAIARANTLSSSTNLPVLVQFALTPPQTIALGAGALNVVGNGNITIDGIDGSGHPWIVGDANATQDTFPFTIDLGGVTQFQVTSAGNEIKGLHIKNTHAAGTAQTANLLWFKSGSLKNLVKSVRIDGGNNCSSGCPMSRDLINVEYAGSGFGTSGHPGDPAVTVRNVEGLSSVDKGIKAAYSSWAVVKDSWFHHNYHGGLQATLDGKLRAERNVVELQGRQAGTNTFVRGANGMSSNAGTCLLEGDANVSRMNTNNGIDVRETGIPVLVAANDYTCGNSQQGVAVGSAAGASTSAQGAGVGAFYNTGSALNVGSDVTSGSVDFGGGALGSPGNNAFARNDATCDVNNSSSLAINAANSQWGPSGTPRVCGTPGKVSTDPVQDHVTVAVAIDPTNPAIPSNVFLAGQTIRVRGSGFNAIDGNPAPDANCVKGNPNPGAGTSCCLTRPKAVNVCAAVNTANHDGTNCVEFRDATGGWTTMEVTSVTPTIIAAQMPTTSNGQPCLGSDSELMRVTKWDYKNNAPLSGQGAYCTNYNEKDEERNPPS